MELNKKGDEVYAYMFNVSIWGETILEMTNFYFI